MVVTTCHSHLVNVAVQAVCGLFFHFMTTRHSKKAGNRPPRPYSRPALRGGVDWREGAKRPPAFIQHQNRTFCIALIRPSGLPLEPFPMGALGQGNGPSARAKTVDPHNRPTAGQRRALCPRRGTDVTQPTGGPQTPSRGPTRGKQFEGCPASAGQPSASGHMVCSGGMIPSPSWAEISCSAR